MKKKLFEQFKQSLQEAGKIKRKKLAPGRTFRVNPHNDVARARGKLGLSQAKFAGMVGVSLDTLQNWEQGRRRPSGPARVLLNIVATHPEVLMEANHITRA